MSYVRVLKSRIPLDNSYENVITFKNINNDEGTTIQTHMSKEAYFSQYDSYFNNTYYYIKTNFKYGDTLTTELRLRTADIGGGVATGLNYVHVINTENARYPRDLFYFITDMLFLSGDIVSLKLELDIFTTYFDYTSIKDDGVLMTKRCHCNRYNSYNGSLGCEEALLPDKLDSLYQGNILKNHTALFTNYKWAIIYLANNTPRAALTSANHTSGGKVTSAMAFSNKPYATLINNVPAPFMVGLIPIDTYTLSTINGSFSILDYGINVGYPDTTNDSSFFELIADSPYVLGIQFSNFDFREYMSASTTQNNCLMADLIGSHDYTSTGETNECPIVVLDKVISKQENASVNVTDLYRRVGLSSDFTKSYMKSQTQREMGLEPKLYTAPYTRFSYTSASDKEYGFEPMLIGQYGITAKFNRVFTPNPTSNGENMFITSEPYNNYKANYTGATALSNNEIPFAPSNYRDFITTQKNSYYTGVAMALVNSMFNVGTGIAAGNTSGIVGGVINGTGELLSMESKFKDLKNQPNKLNGGTYDLYSIMACADTNKYINTWTLIPAEQKKVADYYYKFGYEVDMLRYCTMPSKGINYYEARGLISRSLFNYVQLDENIVNLLHYNTTDIPLSQAVRDKFNIIFNQGVRLWFLTNANDFMNFELENKEIG